jgi:hypothetical protein
MQLSSGGEDVVEARHVAVVHEIQIALERHTEARDAFIVMVRLKRQRAFGQAAVKVL